MRNERSIDEAMPAKARELHDRGFAIFESAYSDEEVSFLRGLLTRRHAELGSPALRANPPYRPAEDVEIGPAGIVLHKLATHHPEIAPRLYKPEIIEALRWLLGEGMYLELPAGVLSDASRPFFDWHTHIDGVDDAYYDNKRVYRTFQRSERATHVLYLDDLTKENGRLLVYPREVTDPTDPPYPVDAEHWEGQVAIECPAGSVVVIEQSTWHAAERKTSPGLRAFVGSYFAAATAKPTPLRDEGLLSWDGDDELFRSILPKG